MNQDQQPRQLSAGEVAQLFQFVQSKNVRQKDVQAELVDHLACCVEDEWIKQPGLSFVQALNKVYSNYPITGFYKFVREQEKAMKGYWRLKLWSSVKSFLMLPKLIIPLILCWGIYQLYVAFPEWSGYLPKILAMVFVVLFRIQIWRGVFPHWKTRNTHLLTSSFYHFSGEFIIAFMWGITVFPFTELSGEWLLIPALFISLVSIWGYAILFVFPKLLTDELRRKYQLM